MEDPSAYDGAYYAQQHIENNSLATVINNVAGDETGNQAEQDPNE
jgi:hypothetical protein